jgi:serine/threonine protein kinase
MREQAPEIFDESKGHSFQVDIWALGVIFYLMMIGRPPFEIPGEKNTHKVMKSRIRQGHYPIPVSPFLIL